MVRICGIRIGTGGTLRLALRCHAPGRVRKDLSVSFLLLGKHEDKADNKQYAEKEQEQRVDKAAQFEQRDFGWNSFFGSAKDKICYTICWISRRQNWKYLWLRSLKKDGMIGERKRKHKESEEDENGQGGEQQKDEKEKNNGAAGSSALPGTMDRYALKTGDRKV